MKWQNRFGAILVALVLSACTVGTTPDASLAEQPEEAAEIEVRLLVFNDFHGALQGPTGAVTVDGERVPVGGVEYFAAWMEEERAGVGHHLTVAAGDMIGATPLISSLFYDEPTVEILATAGLEISSVGNHEFDDGVDELVRIVEGGCHADGCVADREYGGAEFTYLAANVFWKEGGERILPAYEIREFDGVKIGFVGMTLEDTPSSVVPSAIESVRFGNEVETVNELIPELEAEGVDTVVVLLHKGGRATEDSDDVGACPGVDGEIVDIVAGFDPMVSVVVSGHSHQPYVCEFDGRLVTQAGTAGRMFTVIDLLFDAETKAQVGQRARQRLVTREIEPHAGVAAMVARYAELVEPLANRPVATITAELDRGNRADAGNTALGQLIADSQLAAMVEEAGAQIAFMNPGGIRASIPYRREGRQDGEVTFRDLHTVQPFGNMLVTMTLTGAQIHELLEQQWSDPEHAHVLAVSEGFSYEWDPSGTPGERVEEASIMLQGESLKMDESYRITVNGFLADGGDGFTVLTEGRDRVGGPVDVEALAAYMAERSPLTPEVEVRARRIE